MKRDFRLKIPLSLLFPKVKKRLGRSPGSHLIVGLPKKSVTQKLQ